MIRTTFSKLLHLTGDQAYFIYWLVKYNCRVSIPSIKAIDQNLEILVTDEGDFLAYRYDCPIEMAGLALGDGKWHIYHPKRLS